MSTNIQLPPKALNEPASAGGARSAIFFLHSHAERMAMTLGLLLCLYLIWPAFHAVHLEGFTAQTQSIALLKALAPGVEHDPYLPLVSQFIYQTRSAVVDMLAVVYKIKPGASDQAFRGLVFASFILLLGSSMVFAKRWGGVAPAVAFFALVLTPGIPETAFFFNDNIVSAGFAGTALALIAREPKKIPCLFAGAFLGLAILSRVDAVFMFPMVIGVVFYAAKNRRERIVASLMLCLATMLVLISSAVLHGFSLIDVFATASKFVVSRDGKNTWFWVRMYFFGLSAIAFLVIGAWLNLKRLKNNREYMGILTFIVYPVLLVLFAPKATEVRYIFPLLAPMVALHVGTGLGWIYGQCLDRQGKRFRHAVGIVVFSVLVAVSPPTFLKVHDGPRLMLGRLWSPILWSDWQASVDETMMRMDRLVAALDNQQENIIISTHYNDEFYSRLRLMESGFLPMSASGSYPGCRGFSLFNKGNSTVIHIRTDPQYRVAPINLAYNAALQISAALSCESIYSYSKAYITTFGRNEEGLPPKVYNISSLSFKGPLTAEFSDLRTIFEPDNLHLRRNHGILGFKQLTLQEMMELKSKAQNYAARFPERDPFTRKLVKIEAYSVYYRRVPGPTGEFLEKIQKKIGLPE